MKNVNQILEKYWEGETSLEEERLLKEYFLSNEVAEEHKEFRDLFVFFDQESSVKFPVSGRKEKTVVRPLRLRVMGAAAAILIFIMAGFLVYDQYGNDFRSSEVKWSNYEVENPEEAREIAIEALAFLSSKLNKGEENMRSNLKVLEKMPVK